MRHPVTMLTDRGTNQAQPLYGLVLALSLLSTSALAAPPTIDITAPIPGQPTTATPDIVVTYAVVPELLGVVPDAARPAVDPYITRTQIWRAPLSLAPFDIGDATSSSKSWPRLSA